MLSLFGLLLLLTVHLHTGNAVAHGHGGVGRVLPEDLKLNRFEAANQGGGYVDYNSSAWTTSADTYGANGTTGATAAVTLNSRPSVGYCLYLRPSCCSPPY